MFGVYKIFLNDLKEHGLKKCLLKTNLLRKSFRGRRCKEAFEALKIIPDEENETSDAVMRGSIS